MNKYILSKKSNARNDGLIKNTSETTFAYEEIHLEYDSALLERIEDLVNNYYIQHGTKPSGILLAPKDFLTFKYANNYAYKDVFKGIPVMCYEGSEPKIIINPKHAAYFVQGIQVKEPES